jgi:hypothetical protein
VRRTFSPFIITHRMNRIIIFIATNALCQSASSQAAQSASLSATPTAAVATATASANNAVQTDCNPNIKVCPNAVCVMPAVYSSLQQTAGRTLTLSPNASTFFYNNQNINVTWSYLNSNPDYPSQTVNLYYRAVGILDWTAWQVVSAKTTTWMGRLENMPQGSYEVLILPVQ